MPNGGAIPPVGPDEVLYRRIQEKDFDPGKSPYPEHLAFRPNEHDYDGLSLSRASMTTSQAVALGRARPGKRYYAGAILASEITSLNLSVVTDDTLPPVIGVMPDPSHVVIPELNAAVRRDEKTIKLAQQLSRKVMLPIHGPFSLDDLH